MKKNIVVLILFTSFMFTGCKNSSSNENIDVTTIISSVSSEETTEETAEETFDHFTGAYALDDCLWYVTDEENNTETYIYVDAASPEMARVTVTVYDASTYEIKRFWTFSDLTYDTDRGTLTSTSDEAIYMEGHSASVYDSSEVYFRFNGNNCTWSDSEEVFGESLNFEYYDTHIRGPFSH